MTAPSASRRETIRASGSSACRSIAAQAQARNLGIAAAKGELVAFLDADDEWLPEKLARQVAVFAADPRLALVICDLGVTTVDGRRRPLGL